MNIDPWASILQDEFILPSQQRARVAHKFEAEKRLIAAAFRSHLEDYRFVTRAVGYQSTSKRELWRMEAVQWVESDADGLLTFQWFCSVLNLDAEAVRIRLRKGEVAKMDRGYVSVNGPQPQITLNDRGWRDRKHKRKQVA